MIRTHPLRELRRLDGDGTEIMPGCAVGEDLEYAIDTEDWDPTPNLDPGFGIVLGVFRDEYVPDSDEPGLVATVLWSRRATVNGLPRVNVPYVAQAQEPRITLDEVKTRRSLLDRFKNFLKGD